MEDPDELEVNRAKAAPYGDHSLLSQPLSLRRIELDIAYLPFAPILLLVQQPARKDCFISWADDDWSTVERAIMKECVNELGGIRRRYNNMSF